MRLRYGDPSTAEKTVVNVPAPINMIKNEPIKAIVKEELVLPVSKKEIKKFIEAKPIIVKSPKEAVEVKRGRGRPRKETTEKIVKPSKHLREKITVKGKGKK
jgi:hypothetical protein